MLLPVVGIFSHTFRTPCLQIPRLSKKVAPFLTVLVLPRARANKKILTVHKTFYFFKINKTFNYGGIVGVNLIIFNKIYWRLRVRFDHLKVQLINKNFLFKFLLVLISCITYPKYH